MKTRLTFEPAVRLTVKPVVVAGLLAVGLILPGLAGCGEEPVVETVTTEVPATSATPTPTPSPTPTGPVRVADDPAWTPEQLAAVQMVDTYLEVWTRIATDPANANLGEWTIVTVDPYYTEIINDTLNVIALDKTYQSNGTLVIPVSRYVTVMETVDGRSEIHVIQCNVDNPTIQAFENGEPYQIPGPPNEKYDYTVQWVEISQGWRIANLTKVSDGC